MNYKTIINSNGSKWAGESPDSINKLIEVLKIETIEERFFHKYRTNKNSIKKNPIYLNFCPIKKTKEGFRFFGNFEKLSHVFDIETNDPKVIKKLSQVIINNNGWIKYYSKHLIK